MTEVLNRPNEGQLSWDRDLNSLSLLVAFIGVVLVAVVALVQNNVDGKWVLTAIIGGLPALVVAFWPARRLKRLEKQYRERSAKWESFGRWTEDFPTLKDDPPATLELWKKILIYGVAFGTADRMIESGRIPEPVLQSSHGNLAHGYLTGSYLGSTFDGRASAPALPRRSRPSPRAAAAVGDSAAAVGAAGGGGGGSW